jgi:hypothetical protein
LKRAYAQLLNPEERHRLQDEGYAPALGEIEPAVITYTTLVASVAVGELIERLVGYGPLPVPSEIIIRCHDRLFSTNIEAPKVKHYCHRANGKLGLGDSEPYLELIWGK